jgi:hypothetical protein
MTAAPLRSNPRRPAMRRAIAPIIVTLLASAILGATVFREQVAWAAQALDANITNLDSNGNIKVHEQGVASTQDNPVEPVQRSANTDLADGDGFKRVVIYTVPAGKRLVIEGLHAYSRSDRPEGTSFHFIGEVPRARGAGFPETTFDVGLATEQGIAGQTVRLYLAPGGSLSFVVERTDVTGWATFSYTISGYLVPAT